MDDQGVWTKEREKTLYGWKRLSWMTNDDVIILRFPLRVRAEFYAKYLRKVRRRLIRKKFSEKSQFFKQISIFGIFFSQITFSSVF